MTFECALPDVSLADCSDLRQKTIKVGQLGRSFAITKVDRVVLYRTKEHGRFQKDLFLLEKLLRYMDTPQYLRRTAFPMSPSLRFSGMLPPLRGRSHPLETSLDSLDDSTVRWGIQVRPGLVDLGVGSMIEYNGSLRTRVPTIFHVSKNRNGVSLEPIQRSSIPYYFGFEVVIVPSLTEYLKVNRSKTRIAFSRQGIPFQRMTSEIEAVLKSTKGALAVFGGPYSGVRDLVDDSDMLKENIDFWVNTIPNQGTETVRLEEAVLISTGLLNTFFGSMISKLGYYE